MTNHTGKYPMPVSMEETPSDNGLSTGVIETPGKEIEALFEKMEAYGKTTFELAKLKALDVSAAVVTTLVSKLIVVIMAAFFMLIMSVGISIWLSEILGSNYFGYFIVAAFYLILTIVLLQFLHPIIRKILGPAIIKQALQ